MFNALFNKLLSILKAPFSQNLRSVLTLMTIPIAIGMRFHRSLILEKIRWLKTLTNLAHSIFVNSSQMNNVLTPRIQYQW